MRATRHFHPLLLALLLVATATSCGGGGEDGGACDLVANPNEAAFLRVENHLSTGLGWVFVGSYPFGADMRPGECVIMGVAPDQYTVDFQQCTIGNSGCSSYFGGTVTEVFTVAQGQTHTIAVGPGFF